jgi:hypothetical protein
MLILMWDQLTYKEKNADFSKGTIVSEELGLFWMWEGLD